MLEEERKIGPKGQIVIPKAITPTNQMINNTSAKERLKSAMPVTGTTVLSCLLLIGPFESSLSFGITAGEGSGGG